MEDKKQIKINLKMLIFLFSILAIMLISLIIIIVNNINTEYFPIENCNVMNETGLITVYKPIIYLYPEKETQIVVKLGYPNNITCSYPLYTNGWKVLANNNGNLIDLETNRNLYALYYENKPAIEFKIKNEGFVVKSEDTIQFLEEKLEILGLTQKEAEEFIIYWLPKLQENKYNYIRFATMEEINQNMPLNITPNADSTIRILMTYKGLEEPIRVDEQKLVTPKRQGFVAVEWRWNSNKIKLHSK